MPTPNAAHRVQDQLTLGSGPIGLDIFMEPTCPYCERVFRKLDRLLDAAGPERLTVRLRLHSQPWHLFSPVVTRSIIAAGLAATQVGRGALTALKAVYDHRQSFVCDRHCAGPNLGMSPAAVVERISALSGIHLAESFASDETTQVLSWCAKISRQNGIHVSPTFVVDQLISPEMSSGQQVQEWLVALGLAASPGGESAP